MRLKAAIRWLRIVRESFRHFEKQHDVINTYSRPASSYLPGIVLKSVHTRRVQHVSTSSIFSSKERNRAGCGTRTMEEPIGEKDKSVRSMSSTGTALLLHTLNTDPAQATCNVESQGTRTSCCSRHICARSKIKTQVNAVAYLDKIYHHPGTVSDICHVALGS